MGVSVGGEGSSSTPSNPIAETFDPFYTPNIPRGFHPSARLCKTLSKLWPLVGAN